VGSLRSLLRSDKSTVELEVFKNEHSGWICYDWGSVSFCDLIEAQKEKRRIHGSVVGNYYKTILSIPEECDSAVFCVWRSDHRWVGVATVRFVKESYGKSSWYKKK
jgi:hypothetical protein